MFLAGSTPQRSTKLRRWFEMDVHVSVVTPLVRVTDWMAGGESGALAGSERRKFTRPNWS